MGCGLLPSGSLQAPTVIPEPLTGSWKLLRQAHHGMSVLTRSRLPSTRECHFVSASRRFSVFPSGKLRWVNDLRALIPDRRRVTKQIALSISPRLSRSLLEGACAPRDIWIDWALRSIEQPFNGIAQVSGTYGDGDAQTIVENCGNTLILRCSASEGGGTAKFASQLIGDREVIRPESFKSTTAPSLFSSSTGGSSSSGVSYRRMTEAAVMPSQIEQLPDLVGYFKRASSPAWLSVTLTPGAP